MAGLGSHLVLGWNEKVLLPQGVNSGILLGNFHLDWVDQASSLQLGHLVGHCCTEELCSPFLHLQHVSMPRPSDMGKLQAGKEVCASQGGHCLLTAVPVFTPPAGLWSPDAATHEHATFVGKYTWGMLQKNHFSLVTFVLVGEGRQVELMHRTHTAEIAHWNVIQMPCR